jgi:hypothetical protein
MLTQQGGTKVIKLDNGEVAYTASNVDEGKVLYNTISHLRAGSINWCWLMVPKCG